MTRHLRSVWRTAAITSLALACWATALVAAGCKEYGVKAGSGPHYEFNFIDMGDQFINLTQVNTPHRDSPRHFGLVVDDKSAVRDLVRQAGGELLEGPFLDFLDPWGNRLEIIEYSNIQFSKAPNVLRGVGLRLDKNANARKELAEKGMAPE